MGHQMFTTGRFDRFESSPVERTEEEEIVEKEEIRKETHLVAVKCINGK